MKDGNIAGTPNALAAPSWHDEGVDVVLFDVRSERVAHNGDGAGHVRTEVRCHATGLRQRLRRVEPDDVHALAWHQRRCVVGQHRGITGLLVDQDALLGGEVPSLSPVQFCVISAK